MARTETKTLKQDPLFADVEFALPEPVRTDELWGRFENLVAYILKGGGYSVREQVLFGRRHGGQYKLDVMANRGTRVIAVSVKWQRVPGSWEEKVPAEIETLENNIKHHPEVALGYVVLGGPGWAAQKRARWCRGVRDTANVRCIDLDAFCALAWRTEL
jgi:PD-(D/E)XK nuclease superfamily domain